jgi:peptidoglycan hydrolase-like protein with peptidoglycan-binding domain
MPTLTSIYFKGNQRLLQAANSGRPLVLAEKSTGVAAMQAALVDLGFLMPKSTSAAKVLDGRFGAETLAALIKFQTSANLVPADGVAGRDTLVALDTRLLAKFAPKPPAPPKRRPTRPRAPTPPPVVVSSNMKFEDANYKIGTGDPPVTRDKGAGVWNSKSWSFSAITQMAAIEAVLPFANIYPGTNSVKHIRHYFGNSGKDLNIDLEGMIKDVPRAQQAFVAEFRQAQRFIQTLPVGRHQFTSKNADSSYNYKKETVDWFFAIGGYSYWGKGTAAITQVGNDKQYDVEFVFKFFDRYNWDGGKSVEIHGITITDEFMGEFHREGLAREYDCYGEIKRKLSWKGSLAVPADSTILKAPGR